MAVRIDNWCTERIRVSNFPIRRFCIYFTTHTGTRIKTMIKHMSENISNQDKIQKEENDTRKLYIYLM